MALGDFGEIWQSSEQGSSGSRVLTIPFNTDLFQLHEVRARDAIGNYFFSCLCCRFPTFSVLTSSIAFLAPVFSFQVWPQAVLVISFLAGVLVTLQHPLFCVHRIVLGIGWTFKRIGAISSGHSRGVMGWNPLGRRKMMIDQD